MSRDERIRDLMRRLMAMAPEPPPFPEEMTVANDQTEAQRPHPLLVVAAAVAAVAALAVPLFLFLGGGEPDAVATTTTTAPAPTTSTIVETTTTSTPAGTTSTTVDGPGTTVADEVWESVVYLYQQPEDSFVGNPALVPLRLRVDGLDIGEHAPAALAAVATQLPAAFQNAIPPDVQILDLLQSETDTGLIWIADMNEAFLDGAGGLLADFTMLNQLIYTITQGSTEDFPTVMFTVNGQPVDAFGSEGLDLTDPVGRDDFLDQLHLINLTQPVTDSGNGYLVEGVANVFEATVSIAVLDGAGEVVHEEFVTATCGTGCWGEFSTTIAAEHVTPGESSIRVFTSSAEDGSVVDSIVVPIPRPAAVWEFGITG